MANSSEANPAEGAVKVLIVGDYPKDSRGNEQKNKKRDKEMGWHKEEKCRGEAKTSLFM